MIPGNKKIRRRPPLPLGKTVGILAVEEVCRQLFPHKRLCEWRKIKENLQKTYRSIPILKCLHIPARTRYKVPLQYRLLTEVNLVNPNNPGSPGTSERYKGHQLACNLHPDSRHSRHPHTRSHTMWDISPDRFRRHTGHPWA